MHVFMLAALAIRSDALDLLYLTRGHFHLVRRGIDFRSLDGNDQLLA
jgi:hypothetical protein